MGTRPPPPYPALSRLAHRELLAAGEPLGLEALAVALGLTGPGAGDLLGRLLDGRFRLGGGHASLWAWERPFPPEGEVVVALDLELTGGHPERDEVLEVGAARLSPSGEAAFSRLVDPGRPIPPAITRLTGIADADVAGAPPLEETLLELLGFIGSATVVIQDAPRDLAFLTPRFARLGAKLENRVVDTLLLARRALPGRRRRGVDALAWAFNVCVTGRHRALGDARAALGIARELHHALARGRAVTLADLYAEPAHPSDNDSPLAPHTVPLAPLEEVSPR